MEVVLLKDVKDIGHAGQIKIVADGFARNFLLPQRLATPATAKVKAVLSQQLHQQEQKKDGQAQRQKKFFKKVPNKILVFTAKANDKGKLFAAVSKEDILKNLSSGGEFARHRSAGAGFALTEKNIILEQPLKQIGQYHVKIRINDQEASLVVVIKPQSDGKK